MSCGMALALGCCPLGSLSSTLAVLCTQRRCSFVAGALHISAVLKGIICADAALFVQPAPVANTGSIPRAYHSAMHTQMLCATILHNTSLLMATSPLDRTLSPNFRLIAENVASTFDRVW